MYNSTNPFFKNTKKVTKKESDKRSVYKYIKNNMKRIIENIIISSNLPKNEIITVDNFSQYDWDIYNNDKNKTYIITLYRQFISLETATNLFEGNKEDVIKAIDRYINSVKFYTSRFTLLNELK